MSENLENGHQSPPQGSSDQLLKGAIDLHCHGYPEIAFDIKSRLDDVQILEQARSAGMRAVVFKSHIWPTVGRSYYLARQVPGIEAIASVTLNPVAGGLTPWVVEVAARQGARVVWMPTWSSTHSYNVGFARLLKAWVPSISATQQTTTDQSGELLPEVRTIVSLAKQRGLVLCTGHISPRESLAIAKEAEQIGFSKLVFTHPLSSSVRATLEEMKEMTERGGYVELCSINVFYGHQLDKILKFIDTVGPQRCILSTDTFMEWVPPAPEYFRMLIGRLLWAGIDEQSIRIMVKENPGRLLNISPEGNESN